MSSEIRSEVKKQIVLLLVLLGLMSGIGAYLVMKAIQQEDVTAIAVILPLVLMGSLLVRTIVRLRRGEHSAHPGGDAKNGET